MIYKVLRPTAKEWNDKRFVEAWLVDISAPEGAQAEEFKVSAWNGEFSEPDGSFKPTVDVELFKNDKGYWTIAKPKKAAGAAYMGAQKVEQAKVIEEVRNNNIKANMKDKEEGIAYFNARNTALQFVEKFLSNPGITAPSEALENVRKYTKIFFKDWQDWSSQPFHE